ncbi:sialoadhesin-like [Paramormyrops kingsleyae]|uniref:sialoadhesin-like n=1 Tax=Paramormyrops kingsleyae TaxID=1676925 RepID=UPI003B97563F
MGLQYALNFWILAVVFLPGPLGSEWGVEYSRNRLCAIRRSTVVIPCSYKYPDSLRVQTVLWCNDEYCTKSFVFHSSNTDVRTEYKDRAEYLGNKEKNCTLQIKNITDKDAGVYTFRFTTKENAGKYTGKPGTTLTVDELKVVMTSQKEGKGVSEGDSVSLTCGTDSCSLSQSEFTWFKDNQQLPETQSTLHFRPACKYHSANYSCGLKGNRQTVSEAVNLSVEDGAWTVRYSERNLCAVRGSTVLIQCEYEYPEPHKVDSRMWSHNDVDCTGKSYVCHSNNTNISAEYTGRAEFLGNNVRNCTLQIKNIREMDAGEYRFRFITNGCEKCGGPGVTLQVDELKVVMTSSRVNGTIREGDSVNLTCGTDSCPLNQSEFTWFKDNQTLPETQSTLHFSPISYHHTGKYSCALNGRKVAVSNEVNIIVESHFNIIIIITVVGILLIVLIGAVVIIIFMKRINSLNEDKIKEGTKKREDKDLRSDSETQAESAIYANCMNSSKEKSGTSNRYSVESCELPDYGNLNIQERVYGNVNIELTAQ